MYDFRPFLRDIVPRAVGDHRAGGGYRRLGDGVAEPDLYGTAAAVGIQASLGLPLDPALGDAILRFRHADGSLRDPSHGVMHNTATGFGALALLDREHTFPARLSHLVQPTDIGLWLDGLDWSEAWVTSHDAAGLVAIGTMTGQSDEWLNAAFDWLDRAVDPVTGLWHREMIGRVDADPGLFGNLGCSYHFHFLYAFHGRPVPYPQQVVDTCLRIAEESDWIHASDLGYPQLDWTHSLWRSSRQSGHRHGDVDAHLARVSERLHAAVQADDVSALVEDLHVLAAIVALIAELAEALPEIVTVDSDVRVITDVRPFM